MHHHGVVHFEIPASDPDKLSDFYTQLFGWQIEKTEMGDGSAYYMTSTVEMGEDGMPKEPGAINGGIYKRQGNDDRVVNYVNVESVDEYLSKAQSMGATVLMGKMPVPGMGWVAQLADPDGNRFGLWQTDPTASPA